MTDISRLRQLAKEKGVKLSYISDSFGLARTYFASVEQRKATIPPERLGFIADLLDTTPEYLNGLTDEQYKPGEQPSTTPVFDKTEASILSALKKMSEDQKKQVLFYAQFVLSSK